MPLPVGESAVLVAAGVVAGTIGAAGGITSAAARRHPDRTRRLAPPLLVGVSVYAGYFGAGSGIMLLALALVVVDDRLPEANAVKNMLLGVGTVGSAAVFVPAGTVAWAAVVPLAAGQFVGSTIGPGRRAPAPGSGCAVERRRAGVRPGRPALAAAGVTALDRHGEGEDERVSP